MGYLGIQNYNPNSYRDIHLFNFHANSLFSNLTNRLFQGYYILTNQNNEFCSQSPIVIIIDDLFFEISTVQDEEISLTLNTVNLKSQINWNDENSYKWYKSGIKILDDLVGLEITSIKIIGLEYGEIGRAIHGILFDFIKENQNHQVLIRTNYDEISILPFNEDTSIEPKIILNCL